MGRILPLFLFFLILFQTKFVKADVFCEGVISGALYYPNGGYNAVPAPSGTCRWVRIGNAPNSTNCAFLTNSGNYSLQNCPLDDYIWLLILPLGGLGFYYIGRRSLMHLQEV